MVLINSLLSDKILDWFKLKAFADDKIKVPVLKMMIFVFDNDKTENIVGKGENATSIFSFSHNVFKRLLSQGC